MFKRNNIILAIALIVMLPLMAHSAGYLTYADKIGSTTSSGNVQADITRLDLAIGDSTAEILAVQLNLDTHETFLNELKDNLTTHETMLQALQANLTTHEDEIVAIKLNIGTLEDLVNTKANIADVYTTAEVNLALADKADTDSVYTKSAMDILLALKAGITYVNGTDEVLGIRLDSIEAVLAGGSTGEVLTRTVAGYIWATIPAGVTDHTLLTSIGTLTHAQIDSYIASLLANPGGITKMYGGIADTTGITGEVGIIGTGSVSVSRAGNTIEISITAGGTTLKSERATAVGDLRNFDITYVAVTDECQVFDNGLLQWPADDYYLDDNGGLTRIRFGHDVDASSSVSISSVR